MLAAQEGAAEMCDLLIRNGADVAAADFGGFTALDRAVWHNKWDAATMLLRHGAQHDVYTASGLGETELVQDFLQRGPTLLNKEGYFGGAPIHWAAAGGRTDVLQLLVGRGAPVNAVTMMGWTPLMVAARNGHPQAAAFLLQQGAAPGIQDYLGRAALHAAAQAGSAQVVEALLAAGADVNAQNLNGRTPLDLAGAGGHDEVAALLRQHGGNENPRPRSLEEVLRLLQEHEATKPDAR